MPPKLSLSRWFLTALPPSAAHPRRGPLRVWGYAPDGRLWRSSSVAAAPRPRELRTRYGTVVALVGPLDRAAAAAAACPERLVRLFVDGLPRGWRRAAETWARHAAEVGAALRRGGGEMAGVDADADAQEDEDGEGRRGKRAADGAGEPPAKRRRKLPATRGVKGEKKGNARRVGFAIAPKVEPPTQAATAAPKTEVRMAPAPNPPSALPAGRSPSAEATAAALARKATAKKPLSADPPVPSPARKVPARGAGSDYGPAPPAARKLLARRAAPAVTPPVLPASRRAPTRRSASAGPSQPAPSWKPPRKAVSADRPPLPPAAVGARRSGRARAPPSGIFAADASFALRGPTRPAGASRPGERKRGEADGVGDEDELAPVPAVTWITSMAKGGARRGKARVEAAAVEEKEGDVVVAVEEEIGSEKGAGASKKATPKRGSPRGDAKQLRNPLKPRGSRGSVSVFDGSADDESDANFVATAVAPGKPAASGQVPKRPRRKQVKKGLFESSDDSDDCNAEIVPTSATSRKPQPAALKQAPKRLRPSVTTARSAAGGIDKDGSEKSGTSGRVSSEAVPGRRAGRARERMRYYNSSDDDVIEDEDPNSADEDEEKIADGACAAAALPRHHAKRTLKRKNSTRSGRVTFDAPDLGLLVPAKKRKTGTLLGSEGMGQDSDDAEFPGTPMAKHNWSREQLDAFAAQRTAVPPDLPDYWARVAAGVDGKSTKECTDLWQSDWESPAVCMKKRAGGRGDASTPEVAAKLIGAGAAAKKTSKYKANIRRVAAAVNRDLDDNVLEPPVLNNDSGSDSMFDVPLSGNLTASQELLRGTPDTAAKSRRSAAERQAAIQTPEILSRGRSFGLPEADNYMAIFNRRRAGADGSCQGAGTVGKVSKFGKDGGTGRATKGTKKSNASHKPSFDKTSPNTLTQPVDDLFGPESQALANADDDDSHDEDLFF